MSRPDEPSSLDCARRLGDFIVPLGIPERVKDQPRPSDVQAEIDRRVSLYAEQVEQHGRIVAWEAEAE